MLTVVYNEQINISFAFRKNKFGCTGCKRRPILSFFKSSKFHIVEDSLSRSNPVFTFASPPPLLHIFPSIHFLPPVLTHRIACLFTKKVNCGMNVRVACRESLSLHPSLSSRLSSSRHSLHPCRPRCLPCSLVMCK